MTDTPARRVFLGAIALGTLLRAAALPLPGTADVTAFKVWAYHAATDGPTRVYGVGGAEPHRTVIEFAGATSRVNYPPLAVYELAAAASLYRAWSHGRLVDGPGFTVAVKLPGVAAMVGLLLLVARRTASLGPATSRWAASALWLNPGLLLTGSVLGYLDPLFTLPAVAALAAASDGRAIRTGVLASAALLTKPQAILLVPAMALALAASAPGSVVRRVGQSVAAGAGTALLAIVPFLLQGAWLNLVWSLGSLVRDPYLSANACNLWWVAGFVFRTIQGVPDVGLTVAMARPVGIVTIAELTAHGVPDPRVIGAGLVIAVSAWALWRARAARDLWLVAALAAFHVHAFATLATGVHENHLYAAVPLLVLASAGRRRLAPVMIGVSAVLAANLFLFYGLGRSIEYSVWPAAAPIDATVLLALANCALLVWHGAAFVRECGRDPAGSVHGMTP